MQQTQSQDDLSPLEAGEAIAAEHATFPRVSLDDMNGRVVEEHYFIMGDAIDLLCEGITMSAQLDVLTVCVLVLDNGWVLVGKSAPASPGNFERDKGRIFAREDALRQLWPLEGYLLRERLWWEQERDLPAVEHTIQGEPPAHIRSADDVA